jgi:hypothetical protein
VSIGYWAHTAPWSWVGHAWLMPCWVGIDDAGVWWYEPAGGPMRTCADGIPNAGPYRTPMIGKLYSQ